MNDTILRDLFVWRSLIDHDSLERVVERVARAIVPWASPASRYAVELAVGQAALSGVDADPPLDLDQLYDAIAYQSALRVPTAIELTQEVLGAIAHAIGPDARRRLTTELPPAWACLLQNPHDVPTDRRPAPTVDRHDGWTLASAAPGSSTPLCDAAPRPGQSASIASSDDPHGERKLSGGDGPVPRRRTLADAGE